MGLRQLEHGLQPLRLLVGQVVGFAQIPNEVEQHRLSLVRHVVLHKLPIPLPQRAAGVEFMKLPIEEVMHPLLPHPGERG